MATICGVMEGFTLRLPFVSSVRRYNVYTMHLTLVLPYIVVPYTFII